MPTADRAARCHGFELSSVGWGHRALFAQAIEGLFARGLIGPARRQVTETFFRLLRHADRGSYDHVLRRFLGAINPRTEWLLEVPDLFAAVVELGHDFAASRPHFGVGYFEVLAAGGLGETPEQVTSAVALARRLRHTDEELALAFLRGYGRCAGRLDRGAAERFVAAGVAVFVRQPSAGRALLEGTSEAGAALLRELAQECCLNDVRESLLRLVAALAGEPVAVAGLECLPDLGLAPGGLRCLCFGGTLYLPAQVRLSERRERNRSWYALAAAMAAGSLRFGGFSRVHGRPGYPSLLALAGSGVLGTNAILLAEWRRLLHVSCRAWPGLVRVQRFWLDADLAPAGPAVPEAVRRFLLGERPSPGLGRLADAAETATSVFAVAAAVDSALLDALRLECPALEQALLPPLSFLPDALYRVGPSAPMGGTVVADSAATGGGLLPQQAPRARPIAGTDAKPDDGPRGAAVFHYDEWDRDEHDYRRAYCHVREVVPADSGPGILPPAAVAQGQHLRRAFERLKPDSARRERYLRDGDEINPDRLVHFLLQRRAEPSPRVDFYEKPRINRRDLAVLVLLDVSGSTAEPAAAGASILDLERQAAFALGEGLEALADRFALCGFHSAGPKDCSFFVFKDFAGSLDRAAVARLQAAVPARNTRIGAALRHAGARLVSVACRQRLILLVTDGRPLDAGYDPATHYGHCDVRKACEENARLGICTFAVCIDPRSAADMELMFPGRRFAVLRDIGHLPRVLPQLYARLTA
jgi:hypothetical protein